MIFAAGGPRTVSTFSFSPPTPLTLSKCEHKQVLVKNQEFLVEVAAGLMVVRESLKQSINHEDSSRLSAAKNSRLPPTPSATCYTAGAPSRALSPSLIAVVVASVRA